MINTISDLLLELKNKEQVLLDQYKIIKHPGLIGDMYEGLTKEILSKSVFDGLNLNICGGKIINSKGEFSGEIDCMLVVGEGEKIPYTDKFIYKSEKVIAVIQVKKNLFSKDLKDSYENLSSVINVTEFRDGEAYHGRMLRNSWRTIFKEELPNEKDLKDLPIEKEMIYHILLLEAFYPARIVWGYNGFKSELSLRESYADFIGNNSSTDKSNLIKGFGPKNFPSLIICDNYSLIKANGLPFAFPIIEENLWLFYVSSPKNPVYFFLEIIWTRLNYMFGLSSKIFGEDLIIDQFHGFLICKYRERERLKGWDMIYIPADKEVLEKPLVDKDWAPAFIDKTQYVILSQLIRKGAINCNFDNNIVTYIEENGYTLTSFIESLKQTGLVDTTNNVLTLISEKLLCGIHYDGRFFAGENNTGRVTRWINKEIEKKNTL